MTNTEAIEVFEKCIELNDRMTFCINEGSPLYNACQVAIEALKQTAWIPVSERLPRKDEYGDVLVTFIPAGGTLWTTVIIAHYSDLMGIAKPCFYIGDVGKNDFENITEQVTAWQSLPEPYKEGESE